MTAVSNGVAEIHFPVPKSDFHLSTECRRTPHRLARPVKCRCNAENDWSAFKQTLAVYQSPLCSCIGPVLGFKDVLVFMVAGCFSSAKLTHTQEGCKDLEQREDRNGQQRAQAWGRIPRQGTPQCPPL